jgi:hypothetical protein
MKKLVFVALIATLVAGLAGVALAGAPVAITNGELKASYLVWPKIVNTASEDTLITIFNDSSGSAILHCFWMDEYQVPFDFEFEITRYQTVWFKASDGNGMEGTKAVAVSPFHGAYGELKCFAVNDEDLPITRNSFIGTGTIFDFVDGTAIGYNAYGFRRAGAAGTQPVLTLNGTEYDACPAYLLGTFMLDNASFEDKGYTVEAGTTELTLVPCDQDLRQDRLPVYTKVNFTVWDEDEVGATGAYLCFKCWVETTLTDPPKRTGSQTWAAVGFKNFTEAVIGGVFATVKIQPVFANAAVCKFPASAPARPVIGLLFGSTYFNGLYATSGSLLQSTATAWAGAAPTVLYDQLPAFSDKNKR